MAGARKAAPQAAPDDDPLKKMRRDAARLVHDTSTPILTLRALAASISDVGANADLKQEIEKQITRLSERIDLFWRETSPPPSQGTSTDDRQDISASPIASRFEILLVDDDAIHRDIGCRLLAQLGHTATPCADLDQAATLCQGSSYDIVFLDQYCSGMLGSNAVQQRLLSYLPEKTPWIIGMSADPRTEETRSLCLNAGMRDYLEKPITREKLETALNRAAYHLQPRA